MTRFPPARSGRLSLVLAAAAIALATPGVRGQATLERSIGEPTPLLPNGGFDIGDDAGHPIGWAVTGGVDGIKVVNRAADRTAGKCGLEITALASGPVPSVRSERLIAVGGGRYTVAAKVKSKSGTPATLAIEFWSFERKKLAERRLTVPPTTAPTSAATTTGPSTTGPSTAPGAGFQSVTFDATAPEGAHHVVVRIDGEKNTPGVSVWDEVTLTLAPPAYDPAVGAGRELFLDSYRIESAYHVGRVVHPAKTTRLPVLRADKPWEGSAYIYGSVLRENGKLRMWYTAYNDVAPNYHIAYAESADGVTWTKPDLGLVEFGGSKANNLVGSIGTVAFNPDAPADRRYASLVFQSGKPNETLGYYIYFSPDGFKWTAASDKPALFDGDVSNLSFDPVKKLYIATVKKRMFTARTPGVYERAAFVSTSPDALVWTPPRLAVAGDAVDDGAAQALGGLEAQIYGMPVARYESTYVAFPWILQITDYLKGTSAEAGDGPVEIQLATSRDLERWSRPTRARVIEPGPPGSWNAGAQYTASNLLVDDQTVTMYYAAFNQEHGGGDLKDPHRGGNVGQSGMATWRRDGFVSLTNGATRADDAVTGTPGVITTKLLLFAGKSLHLNATVRGALKVEALDADGNALPGCVADVTGDALDAAVKWDGGATLPEGKPIKLRFTLIDADLFSFWATP